MTKIFIPSLSAFAVLNEAQYKLFIAPLIVYFILLMFCFFHSEFVGIYIPTHTQDVDLDNLE